jgi:peptidoglycan biosynthesis protein MviN/MurJ (putative lipid II flippase)
MDFLRSIRSESYKKGILLSVVFNGLAKLILFLLTIIIARSFGNNIKTDIYFFIYSSMILFSGFINAIDTSVLIPESMRLREKEGEKMAASFLNYFLRIYLLLGLLFVVIMFFFGTSVFGWISKFSVADILLYKNYFLIGSCYFFFQVITTYFNNILTSLKYFTIPMIISAINSCIIIVGIFLLQNNYNVLSVLISGIVAYAVNLIILVFILKKVAGWNFNVDKRSISKKVRGNIFYTELGQLATLASSYFPLYLLSGFNSGIISSMSYAKNVADVPNTLLTAQLSNVSGIKLNEEIARNDHQAMNETFIRSAKLLIFLLVPLGCFVFVFSPAIINIFYGSKALNDKFADTAIFLQLLSITTFSIAVNSLVARLFIATQKVKQGFIYQVIMNVILIFTTWLMVKEYGAVGYGWAIIAINAVNFICLYFVCKVISKAIHYVAVLKYAALIILINTIIATGFYFIFKNINASDLLILASAATGWIIILFLLNKAFHLNTDLSIVKKKMNND